MKRIKCVLIALAALSLVLLGGCIDPAHERLPVIFEKYPSDINVPPVEYGICNAENKLSVYFPVVTNMEITGTETGAFGAKLPQGRERVKVKLRPALQDKLNIPCGDKYISFLKYEVEIINGEELRLADTVTLCDTLLWIYHDAQFETVRFDNDHLRITVVASVSETYSPDWEDIISSAQSAV